jgi:Predicted ATPase (AAA+ superfamily)
MLRRKIIDRLVEWKNDPDKKSLLIRGARQVGKTFAVNEFAKNNYGTYVYLNFEEDPELASIFSGSRSVDTIMMNMSSRFKNAEFTPGDTLIFLDEIQNCPNARVAFKFFTIDGRYDVIGSGSLLGVRYKEVSSYPVGYEDLMDLGSLDFEEFLWAMDIKEDIIQYVRECLKTRKEIEQFILNRLNECFRWYMIIGGMPKAVSVFKETNHFGKVLNTQKRIVSGYLDDITKYAADVDKNRVRASFKSIPSQLSKRNKKFVYADVEGRKDSRYDTYGGSLSWLYDAGVIDFCYNLSEPVIPLLANRKMNIFKIYLKDTGLMVSMMEGDLGDALLNGDMFMNEGAIAENIVAEMLTKNEYELNYFERKGTLEIDFVINLNGKAVALEVKSGNNRQAKSLDVVMKDYKIKGMMLENTNVYVDEKGIEHFPIFAAAFIGDL